MSQVRERQNVTELTAVDLGSTVNTTPIITAIETTIAQESNVALRELITESVNATTTSLEKKMATLVQSPVVLRNSFAENYTKAFAEITQNVDVVTKQKMAVVETLANSKYQVHSVKSIELGVQELLAATTTTTLATAVEKMMNEVQAEHYAIFSESIASVVENASVAIGFTIVEVKQTGAAITVIALNEQGQSIQTNVTVDKKTSRVDLVSETFGINDKSCDNILNKFDIELEKAGLKYRKTDIKWKETVDWVPTNPLKKPVITPAIKFDRKKLVNKHLKS
ncbi:MAG: hypothetical protein IPM47_03355 [Sphingobacteriales bacterium]|nr:MAG: hypothetical protein IPM47_03355 [Sphingobacteriales bacterium]